MGKLRFSEWVTTPDSGIIVFNLYAPKQIIEILHNSFRLNRFIHEIDEIEEIFKFASISIKNSEPTSFFEKTIKTIPTDIFGTDLLQHIVELNNYTQQRRSDLSTDWIFESEEDLFYAIDNLQFKALEHLKGFGRW